MSEWEYWYETWGASPGEIWNQTLHTEGKERPKEEEDHSRLVGASFNKQVNLLTSLSWAVARWVDLHTHLPNPGSLYSGLTRAQSHIPYRWSHHILSRLCPWQWISLWQWWAKCTFQGKGTGKGASDCPGPLLRPAGGEVFSITSSNRESSLELQLVTYALQLSFFPTPHPWQWAVFNILF